MLARRTSVPEELLAGLIKVLDEGQRSSRPLTAGRQAELKRRAAHELRDLEANVAYDSGKRSKDEQQGRLSGSEAWRASRAELGGDGAAASGTGSGATRFAQVGGVAEVCLMGGWQGVGRAAAAVQFLASFGKHVLCMEQESGAFKWCSVKKLLKSGGSAWKPLRVVEASASHAWPSTRLVALAADPSAIKFYAVDASDALWEVAPAPLPVTMSAEEKAAVAKQGRTWLAKPAGPGSAPSATRSLAATGSHLVAVSGSRLHRLALAEAKAVWQDGGEAHGVQLVAGSKAGMLVGGTTDGLALWTQGGTAGCLSQPSRVCSDTTKATTTATHVVTALPASAGVSFEVPRVIRAGRPFEAAVRRAATVSGAGAGAGAGSSAAAGTVYDWVGLHALGSVSEAVGQCWAEVPQGTEAGAPRPLQWPARHCPVEPGLYEFRYFVGAGFRNLVAVSAPVRVVEDPVVGLSLAAEASHGLQNLPPAQRHRVWAASKEDPNDTVEVLQPPLCAQPGATSQQVHATLTRLPAGNKSGAGRGRAGMPHRLWWSSLPPLSRCWRKL